MSNEAQMKHVLFDVKRGQIRTILFDMKWGQMSAVKRGCCWEIKRGWQRDVGMRLHKCVRMRLQEPVGMRPWKCVRMRPRRLCTFKADSVHICGQFCGNEADSASNMRPQMCTEFSSLIGLETSHEKINYLCLKCGSFEANSVGMRSIRPQMFKTPSSSSSQNSFFLFLSKLPLPPPPPHHDEGSPSSSSSSSSWWGNSLFPLLLIMMRQLLIHPPPVKTPSSSSSWNSLFLLLSKLPSSLLSNLCFSTSHSPSQNPPFRKKSK